MRDLTLVPPVRGHRQSGPFPPGEGEAIGKRYGMTNGLTNTMLKILSHPHPLPAGESQRGVTLLETVVALGLIAVVLPVLLTGLASSSTTGDSAYDRSVLLELAQSQLEDIQRQPYQPNTASYTLIAAPAGYTISVAGSPAVTYMYPAPKSSPTDETVQLLTVTVTGVRGNLSLQAYKSAGIVATQSSAPTTVTLYSVADSYVDQDREGQNFGTSDSMKVSSSTQGARQTNQRAFVRFDVSSVPSGVTITSATLRLRLTGAPSSSRTYEVHRVSASWLEMDPGGITWDNQPTVGGSATSTTATGTTDGVWLEWTVTADVQAFMAGSAVNYGWRVNDAAESSSLDYDAEFSTWEDSGTGDDPRLVVTYVP